MRPTDAIAATFGSPVAAVGGYALTILALAFILYRQKQPRPLPTKFTLPIILCALGLASLTSTRHAELSASHIAVLLALLGGDAAALGAVRALTVRLWRHGEIIIRQGTWLTITLWLAGLAIHETVDALAHLPSGSLLLYLGVTWIAQRIVLRARANDPTQIRPGPAPQGSASAW